MRLSVSSRSLGETKEGGGQWEMDVLVLRQKDGRDSDNPPSISLFSSGRAKAPRTSSL